MEFDLTVNKISYPKSFPESFIFVQVSNKDSYTAKQFKDYNPLDPLGLNINLIINQTFQGSDQILYTLDLDPSGDNIILISIKDLQKPNDDKPDDLTTSKLAIPDYHRHLKIYLNKVENILHYKTLSARLNKDAIQDAVDIVQSKRIELMEKKEEEVEISGILTVGISLIFFEFGGAEFVLNKVFRAAARLSNQRLVKTVMNSVFVFAGKQSNKSQYLPEVKTLTQSIERLQKEIRQRQDVIDRLAVEAKNLDLTEAKKFSEKLDSIDILNRKNTAKIAAKQTDEALLKINEARVKDELIKIGKEDLERFRISAKTKIKDKKGAIKDGFEVLGQEKTKLLLDELKEDSENFKASDDKTGFIPLDVYCKTFIQNQFDEPLIQMEKLVQLLKDLILDLDLNDLSNKEIHQKFVNQFPFPDELDTILQSFEAIFNSNFNYVESKTYQTKEYEFMIWSMILANKYVEGTSFQRKEVNAYQQLFKSKEIPDSLFGDFDNLSKQLQDYLVQRFSIKINDLTIDADTKQLKKQDASTIDNMQRRALLFYLSTNYIELQNVISNLNTNLNDVHKIKIIYPKK